MTSTEASTEPLTPRAASAISRRTLRRLILSLGTWIRWGLLAASALIGCVILYHSVCLWNLPDIGDPFDTRESTEPRIPDEVNAFIPYVQAVEKHGSAMNQGLTKDIQAIRRNDWDHPSEALTAWIDRNREALELWRIGSERPKAEPPAKFLREGILMINGQDMLYRLNEFTMMALIDSARLRREGDLAKAWTYCRAILRTGRHQQRRGTPFARMLGLSTVTFFRDAANAWINDPKVTDQELRQALADLYDADALLVPNSEGIKMEYLESMRRLDDRHYLRSLRLSPDSTIAGDWQNEQRWYRYLPFSHEVLLYLGNEPERSRRVLKLETANWLMAAAPAELARNDLKEAYPHIVTTLPLAMLNKDTLPPWIDGWYRSSLRFEEGRHSDPYKGRWKEIDQSKVNPLKVRIAEKLYENQHHSEPKSAMALVGPFLKSWPEEVPEP